MTVKTNYTKALIQDGKLVLRYLPTRDMIADLQTKMFSRTDFYRLSLHFLLY